MGPRDPREVLELMDHQAWMGAEDLMEILDRRLDNRPTNKTLDNGSSLTLRETRASQVLMAVMDKLDLL